MASGMKIVKMAGQLIQPLQILAERALREIPGRLCGRRHVERIRRVGQQRPKIMVLHDLTQSVHILRINGLGVAAPWISGKELKGICPNGYRVLSGGGKTLGNGNMWSYVNHICPSFLSPALHP